MLEETHNQENESQTDDYPRRISKEAVRALPLGAFEGEIVVVENHEQLETALPLLQAHAWLGFDTETRPSFKKGRNNPVALLQLSTPDHALLIRLNKMTLSPELIDLLSNPAIHKIGVAIRDDVKALTDLEAFKPQGFIELQDYVKQFGIENFGLRPLAALLLGFRISKSQQLSNWENDELTHAQQVYAATDAWVSLGIYRKLRQIKEQYSIDAVAKKG